MADPTNRSDPTYSNNPNYVWSGGRWQYVSNPQTANDPKAAPTGSVRGESLGTPGGWADVGEGLFDRLSGKPFGSQGAITPAQIQNQSAWQKMAREGAVRQQGVNPYNAGVADQSRAAQLALLAQMRAQQAGPSLAGLQSQRGMAQSGQQALAAAAMGAPGRAAMMQAGQVGAGMAGDAGQARLAEVMRMQAAQGGLAGNLRGNDLRSAEAQAGAGLRAQNIADQRAQFYTSLGARGQIAGDRLGLENDKLNWRIAQAGKETNAKEITNYLNLLASMFGGGMGMGGK